MLLGQSRRAELSGASCHPADPNADESLSAASFHNLGWTRPLVGARAGRLGTVGVAASSPGKRSRNFSQKAALCFSSLLTEQGAAPGSHQPLQGALREKQGNKEITLPLKPSFLITLLFQTNRKASNQELGIRGGSPSWTEERERTGTREHTDATTANLPKAP